MTNADGTKLGKTERGTIWLDAEKTSPYRFFQFWLTRSDADAIPYFSTSPAVTRCTPGWNSVILTPRAPGAAHPGVRSQRAWCMASKRWQTLRRHRRRSSKLLYRTRRQPHRGSLCRGRDPAVEEPAENRVRRCGQTGGLDSRASGRCQIQRRGAPAARLIARRCLNMTRGEAADQTVTLAENSSKAALLLIDEVHVRL